MLQCPTIGSGRLHEAKVTTRNIDPPVDTYCNIIRGMIGRAVFEPESDVGNEPLRFLSHSIMITIKEDRDMRRVQKVKSIVIPN